MKRTLSILLLAATLTWTAGCDELEDVSIDLGGWAAPLRYGLGYNSSPRTYETVWVEEEYYTEDYYVEDYYVEDYYLDDYYTEDVWIEDDWW